VDAEHIDVMSLYEELILEAHDALIRARLEAHRSRALRVRAQDARRAAAQRRLPTPFEASQAVRAA